MGVNVATTRSAIRGTAGTQDFTVTDFGTPKAALCFFNYCTSDGTPASNAVCSVGMTDGTNDRCVAIYSLDARSTTDVHRAAFNDRIAGTSTSSIVIAFDSWVTDGVRINVTTTNGTQGFLTVVLLGGSDLSADVHECSPSTGGTDVTSVGFRPDMLFVIGHGGTMPQTGDTACVLSMGVADYNAGSERNRCVLFGQQNGQAASACEASARNDSCCGQAYGAGVLSWRAAASSFDSSGYTMTANANPGTDEVAVLALAFGGAVDCWVGTMDTPTSTGDDAQAGPSFRPQFVGMLPTLCTSENVIDTSSAGTVGVIAFDGTREYCNTISDEDSQGTTDCQTLSDDQAVNVPFDSGAAAFAAAFSSFDANGWTLTWSDTEETAYKWPAFAIEAEAAAPSGSPWYYYAQIKAVG